MSWYSGISGTVGLVYLGIALVMWTIGGRMYPALILGFTITGVAGILSTPIGAWIRDGWAWVTTTVGKTVGGWTGIAITIVVTIVIGAIVVLNVIGQFNSPGLKAAPGDEGDPAGITGRTIGLGAAFAVTANTLPGFFGTAATWILGTLVNVIAWPITWGFGL